MSRHSRRGWARQPNARKSYGKSPAGRPPVGMRRSLGRRIERLEDRITLTAAPILVDFTPDTLLEGSPVTATFSFTDPVAPGIGLDPSAYADIAATFDPAANMTIDTTALTIPGVGSGVTAEVNTGSGIYEIAVFTFGSIEIDAGITVRAEGSRPLALLSKSGITIVGTLDVSATEFSFGDERLAGAGGGNGGFGNASGSPAAGSPASSAGQSASRGGGGGAFGGDGGPGSSVIFPPDEPPRLVSVLNGGIAFGNLAVGIQGGSGGGGGAFSSGGSFINQSPGGGGGGGVELGAVGTITIDVTGKILANGGDGQRFTSSSGGGGGAGGGILLHAANVSLASGAVLSARGGDGAGSGSATQISGGGGGGGRVLIAYSDSAPSLSGVTIDVSPGVAQADPAGPGVAGTSGVTLSGSTETYSYKINWGDGSETPVTSVSVTPGPPGHVTGTFTASHTYADGAEPFTTYVVTVTVTDAGGEASSMFCFDVNNVDPTLAISGASNVDEGSPYTLNLSSFDPGADTITSWTINWGDGSDPELVSGNPASVTHAYADGDAVYTITATATDEDGTFAAGNSVTVSVDNVAPTLVLSGALTVEEGSTYTLGLSSADPGADTIVEWTIDWGDGHVETVTGDPSGATHTYEDGNANYTISATATDEDGTFSANSLAVNVANVDPTITSLVVASFTACSTLVDQPVTLTAAFVDVPADAHTATIEWGDGQTTFLDESQIGQLASLQHAYAVAGVYTVKLTITDDDGGSATAEVETTVSGVFVDAVNRVLYVIGTECDDVVDVSKSGSNALKVTYKLGGGPQQQATISLTAIDAVHILLGGGNDKGTVGGTVSTPATIDGGAGNDVLAGGNGNTLLLGGDGNDKLTGGNGDNHIFGGAGNDQLIGGNGNDYLDGGDGDDQLDGGNGNDVLIGGAGNDKLVGGNGDDHLDGGDGDDQLDGGNGNDVLIGGSGHDVLLGGNGDDWLDAGAGNDILVGGNGDDVLHGGSGNDVMSGGNGDDVLLGGEGDDVLVGDNGNDVLVGGDGDDQLDGGNGNDLMIGGAGGDALVGGNGEDILIAGWTDFDADVNALDALMAEWSSGRSYAHRVANITGAVNPSWTSRLNGNVFLIADDGATPAATVFDDGDSDSLTGGNGNDLFFARLSGTEHDWINDLRNGDLVEDLVA